MNNSLLYNKSSLPFNNTNDNTTETTLYQGKIFDTWQQAFDKNVVLYKALHGNGDILHNKHREVINKFLTHLLACANRSLGKHWSILKD
ncbi:hypothetical protein Glove_151g61 [Diversispora epigaea]|uniref:Uncharacterized protein n=1 Tax=Diversispora epigaea TaxID=1348612 RepID=A0A397IT95_9GLOM|nr:hypothetical protein Glove_151g61 [Diversispora epigaea]